MTKGLFFVFFIALIFISGCSATTETKQNVPGIYKDAPEWVLASDFAFGVSGAGMAAIDDDYESAYKEAEENAKTDLYINLNKKIRACLFDLFKKSRTLENEAFARIGENIAQTAAGTFKTKESWQSPNNGIFVLVVSDVDVIRDAFKIKLMDFLSARKPEGFDPQNPKIREDLEKYANMHFRYFRKL
ncbi:hypothetical protein [Desulforegula conservatrix]|uniref:hypothetical protein n=1 Tax=Desulforegula conservatrix TaxID=153026 RepID=UPI000412C2C4|nr:hypothetical protein [Desulforegula conservatrix]